MWNYFLARAHLGKAPLSMSVDMLDIRHNKDTGGAKDQRQQ